MTTVKMVCSSCRQSQDHLIKTFVGSFNRSDSHGKLVTCHLFCRRCVVGKVLPVWRPTVERWQIGEVKAFDTHSGKHHIVFPDDTTDCVIIEQTPYEDYLAHYRGRSKPNSSRVKDEDDIEPIPLLQLQRQRRNSEIEVHDTKENERMMKRALKRLAANQNDDDPDNVDWSLRRVVEASVVSPIRDTKSNNVKPANEGFFVGRNHWQGTKSEAHQPPLNRTISNGYPPRNPVIPIPPPVAFESRNQENAVYRKPGPRMWNFEEDKELIKSVEAATEPIKWTAIAASIEGRTGKQCRERFLNHLKPKLKKEEWSAPEDALLFHLYTVFGTKWALMRKALPGRTDNRIKNRFHFMRRRIEKDAEKYLKTGNNKAKAENETKGSIPAVSPDKQDPSDELETKIRDMIPHVAAETLKKAGESPYKFGPFRTAKGEACKRCSLMAPSLHTGRVVCEATGWCEACTRLPPYICGANIRKCLNLRKVEHTGKNMVSIDNVKKE